MDLSTVRRPHATAITHITAGMTGDLGYLKLALSPILHCVSIKTRTRQPSKSRVIPRDHMTGGPVFCLNWVTLHDPEVRAPLSKEKPANLPNGPCNAQIRRDCQKTPMLYQ